MPLINFDNPYSPLEHAIKIDYLITEKFKKRWYQQSETNILAVLQKNVEYYSLLYNISFHETLNKFSSISSLKKFISYFNKFSRELRLYKLLEQREKLRKSLNKNELKFIDIHVEAFYFTLLLHKKNIPWQTTKNKFIESDMIDIYQKYFNTEIDLMNIGEIAASSLKTFIDMNDIRNHIFQDPGNLGNFFDLNCSPRRTIGLDYLEVGRTYWNTSLGAHYQVNDTIYYYPIEKNKLFLLHFIKENFPKIENFLPLSVISEYLEWNSDWEIDINNFHLVHREFILLHELFHKMSYNKYKKNKNPYEILGIFEKYDVEVIKLLFESYTGVNEIFADYFAKEIIESKYKIKNYLYIRLRRFSPIGYRKYFKNFDKFCEILINKLNKKIEFVTSERARSEYWYFPNPFEDENFWNEIYAKMDDYLLSKS